MNSKKMKSNLMKIIIIAIIFLIVAFVLILSFHISTEKHAHLYPNYEQTDLNVALGEVDFTGLLKLEDNYDTLTDSQYKEIFMQTGLGKVGADTIIRQNLEKETEENVKAVIIEEFEKHQQNFFADIPIYCEKIGIITFEEYVEDGQGEKEKLFEIVDVKDGDVFITKNTHSLGWRHGHSAIVIDEEKGNTLEAIIWGEESKVQRMDKWESYPSFIQLRPKGDIEGAKAASYAKEHLEGLPYGLLTGIPFKEPKTVKKTQCAHIVWFPYKKLDVDIDYDKGWLVTPKDIANSKHFDVVQVYGTNPLNIWE